MKRILMIVSLLALCCNFALSDQTSDTFRRDINKMKTGFSSYSSATQIKLNTKLNKNVFNTYTSVDRLPVAVFKAYTSIDRLTPTSSGQELTLSRVESSTYSTIQHLQNLFHSSGYTSGGAITDAGGGSINVAAGTGTIRATDSNVATINYFDWPASNGLAITADTIRYVGVEYNGGTPQVTVRTTQSWNYQTDFPLGKVVNESGTLHIFSDPQAVGDHASKMIQREYDTMPLAYDMRAGGLILGETGTRNLTVSAGALWDRLNKYSISAIDTSAASNFDIYYRDGSGGFTKTASQTQWPNTQYDDGSGTLATMTAARYANVWFYIETDGGLVAMYGQNQYTTLASALTATGPAALPNRLIAHGKLIGRLTFQKSASTASEIASVFTSMLAVSGTSTHNNLAGLQGGTTAEYYHLTSAEYTGTGTGNFAKATNPVFTTPNIGSATGSISGNAGTATALAANGTNCNAGESPLGIDASGNSEGCFTPSGTYSLPTATSSVLGGVKPDGTSILNAAGSISATAASVGALASGGTAADSDKLDGQHGSYYAPLVSPTFTAPALGTPASGNLANCTFPTLNQNTSGTAGGLSANISESQVTNLVTDLAGKSPMLNIAGAGNLNSIYYGNVVAGYAAQPPDASYNYIWFITSGGTINSKKLGRYQTGTGSYLEAGSAASANSDIMFFEVP